MVDVSLAIRAAPRPDVHRGPFGQVIDGLAILVSDGRAAAEPVLRDGCLRLFNEDLPADNWLHWGVLGAVGAAAVWDVDSSRAVSTPQVELARGELGRLWCQRGVECGPGRDVAGRLRGAVPWLRSTTR